MALLATCWSRTGRIRSCRLGAAWGGCMCRVHDGHVRRGEEKRRQSRRVLCQWARCSRGTNRGCGREMQVNQQIDGGACGGVRIASSRGSEQRAAAEGRAGGSTRESVAPSRNERKQGRGRRASPRAASTMSWHLPVLPSRCSGACTM